MENERLIKSELVCNIVDQTNPEGSWNHIDMERGKSIVNSIDGDVCIPFQKSFLCTAPGTYEYTARILIEKDWQWLGEYQKKME